MLQLFLSEQCIILKNIFKEVSLNHDFLTVLLLQEKDEPESLQCLEQRLPAGVGEKSVHDLTQPTKSDIPLPLKGQEFYCPPILPTPSCTTLAPAQLLMGPFSELFELTNSGASS